MREYEKTLENLGKGAYQNFRTIDIGSIPFNMRDILVRAPFIAGLNVYLVGATGEGKTQLSNDFASLVSNSYCYNEGRPDFELSELLKQVRLDRVREARTDKELVELTENVQKALFYVDELNRCPPLIQNHFFNFFDGKFTHLGKILPLGKRGYSLGYASGNIGNGSYVGISDVDRALKDRMHLIVKLDYPDFRPTPCDKFEIYGSKKDPRASLPKGEGDCLDEIIEIHNRFKEREVPAILPMLGVLFSEGLDYLENTKKHSKRAVDEKWPRVNGIRADTDESKIFPLSTRSVFAAIALSQALEMIAESRGVEIKSSVPLFLDCMRFTVPYSGVLAQDFVFNEHDGDAYTAFDAILGRARDEEPASRIRDEIEGENGKLQKLEQALCLAESGKTDRKLLDDLAKLDNPAEGRWLPVREAIIGYAEKRQENQSEEGMKIKDILEKAKKAEEPEPGEE